MNAPSQWETTLHCNVVSHWLDAYTNDPCWLVFFLLYHRSPEGGMGYTGFTPMSVRPSVRPSTRPSVDKVSGTFWKKLLAQRISYLAFTLMGWVSWPLFIFMFLASFSALWWPGLGSSKVLVLGTWYLMQNLEYLVLTCTWHFEIQKYLVLTCTWRQSTWYLSKYFQVLLSN